MDKAAPHYTLDDLPRFSPWPARLLGLETWDPRIKTPEEVVREYEGEKWGPLLSRCRESNGTIALEQVDEWVLGSNPPTLCSVQDGFELLSMLEAHKRYLRVVESTLKTLLPFEHLVELGAGYGSIILALARDQALGAQKIYAGEYTPSGESLLRRLADYEGIDAIVGHCDLTSDVVADFEIPAGAVIYTSMATMYVPVLDRLFVERVAKRRPKMVVHFEPCYEHLEQDTLLGAMRKRYIEVNDYNRNLVSVLHEEQAKGKIDIKIEKKTVFGINPLLPTSVVGWCPTR